MARAPRNFWKTLKKPIMTIAPMANVTDAAFRRMFVECGTPPDVFWTEFVSVEGLLSRGKERLLPDLWFSPDEHPIVAQIFGAKPEQFEAAAGIIRELGFDGIDINMGCPDRAVEKQGAGAMLMKNPKLAQEIIRATKRGAGGLPVSVKTRIGYLKNQIDEWIPALLEEDIAALTVHLRTRKEMSLVPAHWDLAPHITALRDRLAPGTILLGNGDITDLKDAKKHVTESGFDGAMVGRGVFGNPWFFSGKSPTLRQRLTRMVKHTAYFEQIYKSDISKNEGSLKNFDVMKKHFKAYCSDFDNAKELRILLMGTKNATEVKAIVTAFFEDNKKHIKKSLNQIKK
jgi:nifR3 family TIM-barrel protein